MHTVTTKAQTQLSTLTKTNTTWVVVGWKQTSTCCNERVIRTHWHAVSFILLKPMSNIEGNERQVESFVREVIVQ